MSDEAAEQRRREAALFEQINSFLKLKKDQRLGVPSSFNRTISLTKAKLLVQMLRADLDDQRVRKQFVYKLIKLLERTIAGSEKNELGADFALLAIIDKVLGILSEVAVVEIEVYMMENYQEINSNQESYGRAPIFKDLEDLWFQES